MYQEWEINVLGYEYLILHKKPKIAESIFRANTILHPNSANVFDSYAESLMMNGDLKASAVNYQKAIDLGIKNGDPNLQLFKDNLAKVKSRLAEKK